MIPWQTLPGSCAPSASLLWLTGATTSHMAGWRAGAGQDRTGHPPWRKLRRQFGRSGSVNGLCSNTGFLTERIGILSQRKIDFNTTIIVKYSPPLYSFSCSLSASLTQVPAVHRITGRTCQRQQTRHASTHPNTGTRTLSLRSRLLAHDQGKQSVSSSA